MFEYRAKIEKVVDGDTVVARIDLGCRITLTQHLRLLGINTPERRDAVAWKAARDYLVALVDEAETITVRTRKDETEKYGRYLALLFRDSETESLNQRMVDAGHAVPFMLLETRPPCGI